ncbi:hypothetical protein BGW38_010628 [Lunasporangiospora selenospora]|uniref:Glucosidase II subunit alpha n=1 Tax=Lunasporangiospora selenospora TaxID=979761 RepID=A0A9P6KIH7_9FUNG|nr:hypothetical protein BGW38_010628 [Lunasporangiospora selenospora]
MAIFRSALALGLAAALTLSTLTSVTEGVKREDFKTCAQSGFCTRHRAYAELVQESSKSQWKSPYQLNSSSLRLSNGILSGDLYHVEEDQFPLTETQNKDHGGKSRGLTFELHLLESDLARIRINERDPLYPRYDGVQETVLDKLALTLKSDDMYSSVTKAKADDNIKSEEQDGVLEIAYGPEKRYQVNVHSEPFKIEFFVDGTSTVVLNGDGLLRIERTRKKPEDPKESESKTDDESKMVDQESEVANGGFVTEKSPLEKKLEEELWEESFKTHTDSKPRGPESFGMDIAFSGMKHVYGIPEHASSLSLKATKGPNAPYSEPYRLYNLDVFEYELDNPMALYGSIPFMMGHSKGHTAAVFWLNAAETWVDVEKDTSGNAGNGAGEGIMSWIKSKKPTTGPKAVQSTKTHWISESGVLDLFVFLGPTQKDIYKEFANLVGSTAMPQQFAIAYQQCRWNYNNQDDVKQVDKGFDEHDIPYDVLWLDIEHTNGKRYFTWDAAKFPDPTEMQQELAAKTRKMVTIIDPHIKKDSDYKVFKEGSDLDIYIKNKDGTSDFEGWCWPGSSQWIDFYNPKARDYWASRFQYDNYEGSTGALFTWNDMNEPSVFNGPEITIPKDVLHYGGVEHRNVHNLYGTMFRYGAIWTGDNTATWEHLEVASPMLLTIGISGIPFSGADVGGFFGNPDAELLTRWYQAGAYYPFFRAHAHLDSKRREPWLFGEPYTSQIREAIRMRYKLLPFWYTLFHEASVDGAPIIRPMFTEFPEDEAVFDMDDQFMVGDALLVKPVAKPGVTRSSVYFAGSERWFELKDEDLFSSAPAAQQGPGYVEVDSPASKIPVYQRAGTIVPRKDRPRRSSKAMEKDPFTLRITINSAGESIGKIYLDDGESFGYQSGDYVWREFNLGKVNDGFILTSKDLKPANISKKLSNGIQELAALRIERLVIAGLPSPLKKVTRVDTGESAKSIDCRQAKGQDGKGFYACVVKEPNVAVGEDFELALN